MHTLRATWARGRWSAGPGQVGVIGVFQHVCGVYMQHQPLYVSLVCLRTTSKESEKERVAVSSCGFTSGRIGRGERCHPRRGPSCASDAAILVIEQPLPLASRATILAGDVQTRLPGRQLPDPPPWSATSGSASMPSFSSSLPNLVVVSNNYYVLQSYK